MFSKLYDSAIEFGGIAQLGERLNGIFSNRVATPNLPATLYLESILNQDDFSTGFDSKQHYWYNLFKH